MRLSLFHRVVLYAVIPCGALLMFFALLLVQRQSRAATEELNVEVSARAHDQALVMAGQLQGVTRSIWSNADLAVMMPELANNRFWQWFRSVLDASPALYGTGATFWPANREGQRKDLYALRGPFGNAKDERYYYQDETYTYDGTDGTHPWFSDPQKSGKPTWSEPYFDEGSGNIWMVTYSVPFYRTVDGIFDGVAFGDFSLASLRKDLIATELFKEPFLVITPANTILLASEPSLDGKPLKAAPVATSLADLLGARPKISIGTPITVEWPGRGMVRVVREDVPNTPYILISALPDNAWLWGMGVEEWTGILILFSGLSIIMLITLVATKRFTDPLIKITTSVNQIARGNLEVEVPQLVGGELGSLSSAVCTMRDALQSRERELKDANLGLEKQVEKRTEALMMVSKRLREITNSIPGVVFQCSYHAGGGVSFSYVSEGFESLCGIAVKLVLSDAALFFKNIAPQDANRVFQHLELALEQSKPVDVEFRYQASATTPVYWLRLSAQTRVEQSDVALLNGYLIDVSSKKQLEHGFAAVLRDAEQANAAKSQFLAGLSHELRTPLNAVIGLSDLVLNTSLDTTQRDYLNKIQRSANTQLRLINDLLDFSKLEAGKLELESIPFDLGRVLDGVQDMLLHRAQEKGLQLLFTIAANVPRVLIGDALRLGQILLNLTGNAIKFTARGSVHILVDRSNDGGALWVQFEVRDTGIGISDADQKRLFTAFTQADASTTRKFGGTGLGLAICKQIAEAMGGSITLQSTIGLGSSFIVRLPFQVSEAGSAHMDMVFTDDTEPSDPALALEMVSLGALESARREQASLQNLLKLLSEDNGDAVDAWQLILEREPVLATAYPQLHAAIGHYDFATARDGLTLILTTLGSGL